MSSSAPPPRADCAGGPGADALYRLDTLRDLLGGLQAEAMLVSYAELPTTPCAAPRTCGPEPPLSG